MMFMIEGRSKKNGEAADIDRLTIHFSFVPRINGSSGDLNSHSRRRFRQPRPSVEETTLSPRAGIIGIGRNSVKIRT